MKEHMNERKHIALELSDMFADEPESTSYDYDVDIDFYYGLETAVKVTTVKINGEEVFFNPNTVENARLNSIYNSILDYQAWMFHHYENYELYGLKHSRHIVSAKDFYNTFKQTFGYYPKAKNYLKYNKCFKIVVIHPEYPDGYYWEEDI